MSNEVSVLNQAFEGHGLRIITREGEPWLVMKEVCKLLGHTNSRVAGRRLDADEKLVVNISDPRGRTQAQTIISESAVYHLIMTSRLPVAKRFSKWVRSEVLPSIRKAGAYTTPDREPEADPFDALADHLGTQRAAAQMPALPPLRATDPFEAQGRDAGQIAGHHAWQLSDRTYRRDLAKLMIFMELAWEQQPNADAAAICRFAVDHPHLLDHPAIWARATAKAAQQRLA